MSLIYKVKSVETIYNQMKQYMIGRGSSITNFNEGSRTRTILEAISTILHKSQFDFSTAIKSAIPVSVFNGFNFARLGGIAASGKLEFTRAVASGEDYPIPEGTTITLDGVNYETSEAGEIHHGDTSSGQINAKCSDVGIIGNINTNAIDIQGGQGSFVDQPVGIENCTNPVAFTGGEDQETDDSRIKRFRQYVNALARSTPPGMLAGAKSVSGVVSASIVENQPQSGWNTIYVDDGSGALPAELKAEVEKVINGDPNDRFNYPGYRAAGIQVIVDAPTVVNVDVTAEIRILQQSLSDDSQLRDLCQSEVERYINTLGLGYDVNISEIVNSCQNVHDDIYDVIVTLPLSNITINAAEVARTTSVVITSTRINP